MSLNRVSTSLNEAAFRVLDRPDVSRDRIRDDNASLTSEIARLRLRIIELERAADTDPLVPVYNRRAFMRELERAQAVRGRYEIESTVIFVDLNGFKKVNDDYGHAVGDELLTKIGEALTSHVRHCDMVARLGGDEFGILLFKSSKEVAYAKAASLACLIASQKIICGPEDVAVSAAWGISACDADMSPEQILDRADREMYTAKRVSAMEN